MIAKAKLKFIRISSKKVRDVIYLIRNKKIDAARDILFNLNKAASKILLKVLNSAASNVKEDDLDSSNLYISKIVVNQGPTLKRFRAQAFGRAAAIRKRTSHIEIEIDKVKKDNTEDLKHKVSNRKSKVVKLKPKRIATTKKKSGSVQVKKKRRRK